MAIYVAVPHHLIAALGNWDGAWYGTIAARGYQNAFDGAQGNLAFFPLFPLLSWFVLRLGIGWPLAGALINNAAFLGGLFLVYDFARKRFDAPTARWATAMLCALPLSLFCSVAYSEGLFILLSTAALCLYDRKKYALSGVMAACASATRPLGIALALSLVVTAIVERRGWRTILVSTSGFGGIAAFALYCELRFRDALAFVHAQDAWRHNRGFDFVGWQGVLRGANLGRPHDWIVLLFLILVVPMTLLCARKLGTAGILYIGIGFAMLLFAGTPLSVDRNMYSIVPLIVAIGTICRRLPLLGTVAIACAVVLLALDAFAFAKFQWVA
ncbi:MAG: hypothetical protein M3R51_09130 [Candidatus Eremiobacteraeota bacterium]|nr:hypothetical protein [Candidatus Eremiobacteraeota bacterium]